MAEKINSLRDSMRILKKIKRDYDSRGDAYGTKMRNTLVYAIGDLNDIPSNKTGFASELATAAQHGNLEKVEEVSNAIKNYRNEIAQEI